MHGRYSGERRNDVICNFVLPRSQPNDAGAVPKVHHKLAIYNPIFCRCHHRLTTSRENQICGPSSVEYRPNAYQYYTADLRSLYTAAAPPLQGLRKIKSAGEIDTILMKLELIRAVHKVCTTLLRECSGLVTVRDRGGGRIRAVLRHAKYYAVPGMSRMLVLRILQILLPLFA